MDNRIQRCLAALRRYGGAARSEIPRLRALEAELAAAGKTPEALEKLGIEALIDDIGKDRNPPELRPLPAPR
jgi:hypothetical protein